MGSTIVIAGFTMDAARFFLNRDDMVRIALGEGVCGAAAQQLRTILVDNVHDFPGHIACDSASNSEIVIPIIKDKRLIGVLDLDSPSFGRFNDEDALGLNELLEIFVRSSEIRMT
jgi:L-methionine (R)-S-oxide reductase